MATRSFTSTLSAIRTPLLAASFGVTATVCLRQQLGFVRPLRLDSAATRLPSSLSSSSFSTYAANSDTPLLKSGRLNPKAVRQISTGSILGVLAGLGVSVFSKPLTVILGLVIVGVQVAESYGIRLVPYKTIQRYVKGIDIKSSLQENVPFKISFGLIFALTGFGSF